ncbi:MAG: hypothetical protein JST00_14420 [Deltaproteobacteria bacterium]|nr:hypothetical protein [Deltaproteobacteria bacterium]
MFVTPSAVPPAARKAEPKRQANDSHVRLRAPMPHASSHATLPLAASIEFLDAVDLLDELCEDQITLSMNLACLEQAAHEAPNDASARAAIRTLTMRIADLAALRDALATVQSASADPRVQRLYAADSPLADYARGLYAWAHAVVRALDTLASSLKTLSPDWAMLRWRIDEAKNFHFDELQDAIRKDLVALSIVANAGALGQSPPDVDALTYAVERLFSTANALEEHLDERFG